MGIRIWHDDVRQPPSDDWTWVRTNDEARKLLRAHEADEISLDHDLGELVKGQSEDTGLKLVDWMIAEGLVPPRVTIHSWNPVGANKMLTALRSRGYRVQYVPYQHPATKKPSL